MSIPEKDLIVGGQAVVEGVMMRTPSAYAVAVRKADGTIVHIAAALPKWSERYPILQLPLLRGAATLIQSMSLGVKALNYSASQALGEAEAVAGAEKEVSYALQPAVVEGEGEFAAVTGAIPGLGAFSGKSKNRTGSGSSASIAGSIIFALLFNVLLFIVAPLLLTNMLFVAAGWAPARAEEEATQIQAGKTSVTTNAEDANSSAPPTLLQRISRTTRTYLHPVRPSVAFNLVDGLIRMLFFLVMIFSFSKLKDIRRVFEYHGAEHKTVFTWESGLALTVENARPQPRQHPRCGTSFLMVVMLVSIALFSVIKFDSLLLNMAIRIALIPLVAGLSYEIIRLSARREGSVVFKLLTLPGVWLQNITTQEPDDEQLEVAIFALKESLKYEPRPNDTARTAMATAPLA